MAKINRMKASEGYVYLVIVPNHWGKGATLREAFANVKKAGGETDGDFQIFLADPQAHVDEMGRTIERPADGKKAIQIGLHKTTKQILRQP